MREVLTAGLSATLLLVAAAPAFAQHTPDDEMVPVASHATVGPGWFAVRFDNEAHPTDPFGGPELRIDISVDLEPHQNAVIVGSLWNAETNAFLGAPIVAYFASDVGLVASSRTLGGTLIEPLTPARPASTVTPGFLVHSCCGERQVLVSWASDAPIGAVRIDVSANDLVTFGSATSGIGSFLVRNDDFGSLAHVGVGAGVGPEARAIVSGRATVSASSGEFFGFFLGVTELGDDPLVCDLRIIGPDLDVETQFGNDDPVCGLVARDDTPGDYQLRVERFLAPNLFTGDEAQVFAVGAFAQLP